MADIFEEKKSVSNCFLHGNNQDEFTVVVQPGHKCPVCIIRDIIMMNPQLNMRFLLQKFMTVLGHYRLPLISLTSVYQLTHNFVPYSSGKKKKKKFIHFFLMGW